MRTRRGTSRVVQALTVALDDAERFHPRRGRAADAAVPGRHPVRRAAPETGSPSASGLRARVHAHTACLNRLPESRYM